MYVGGEVFVCVNVAYMGKGGGGCEGDCRTMINVLKFVHNVFCYNYITMEH